MNTKFPSIRTPKIYSTKVTPNPFTKQQISPNGFFYLPMSNPSICIEIGFDCVDSLILKVLILKSMLKFKWTGIFSMMSE
jgi:hypothetical protein